MHPDSMQKSVQTTTNTAMSDFARELGGSSAAVAVVVVVVVVGSVGDAVGGVGMSGVWNSLGDIVDRMGSTDDCTIDVVVVVVVVVVAVAVVESRGMSVSEGGKEPEKDDDMGRLLVCVGSRFVKVEASGKNAYRVVRESYWPGTVGSALKSSKSESPDSPAKIDGDTETDACAAVVSGAGGIGN